MYIQIFFFDTLKNLSLLNDRLYEIFFFNKNWHLKIRQQLQDQLQQRLNNLRNICTILKNDIKSLKIFY